MLLGCPFHHIVVGQGEQIVVCKGCAVVDLMTEGAVHLHGNIPLLVTEGDVGTHHGLGRGLSADIRFVGDVIIVSAVEILDQTIAMW